MTRKAWAAALLPVWGIVGTAWFAATLTFAAAHASRIGCIEHATANLAAVAGVAGLSLAAASLLLVAVVPAYRSALHAVAAVAPLALSLYAMVALLARNGAVCG